MLMFVGTSTETGPSQLFPGSELMTIESDQPRGVVAMRSGSLLPGGAGVGVWVGPWVGVSPEFISSSVVGVTVALVGSVESAVGVGVGDTLGVGAFVGLGTNVTSKPGRVSSEQAAAKASNAVPKRARRSELCLLVSKQPRYSRSSGTPKR